MLQCDHIPSGNSEGVYNWLIIAEIYFKTDTL
jgi:hypothetical protein